MVLGGKHVGGEKDKKRAQIISTGLYSELKVTYYDFTRKQEEHYKCMRNTKVYFQSKACRCARRSPDMNLGVCHRWPPWEAEPTHATQQTEHRNVNCFGNKYQIFNIGTGQTHWVLFFKQEILRLWPQKSSWISFKQHQSLLWCR